MKSSLLAIPVLLMAIGCSHKTNTTTVSADKADTDYPVSTLPMKERIKVKVVKGSKAIPQATAFRMNGDYADNVAVTIGNDGELSYFPAPTDITADSRPTKLTNEWWLNNQGLGKNSVFTTYTFEEYAELSETPSPEQIKKAIIPGSGVTEFVALPFSISSAGSHLQEINEYLSELD